MSTIKIAINGFGRIGRTVFRLLLNRSDIDVVAVNDLSDSRTLSHLLKYDSIHGIWPGSVSYNSTGIIVEQNHYPLLNEKSPEQIDWMPWQPDIVIEASGKFKRREQLQHHIKNGARQVLLSVPPEDDDI